MWFLLNKWQISPPCCSHFGAIIAVDSARGRCSFLSPLDGFRILRRTSSGFLAARPSAFWRPHLRVIGAGQSRRSIVVQLDFSCLAVWREPYIIPFLSRFFEYFCVFYCVFWGDTQVEKSGTSRFGRFLGYLIFSGFHETLKRTGNSIFWTEYHKTLSLFDFRLFFFFSNTKSMRFFEGKSEEGCCDGHYSRFICRKN